MKRKPEFPSSILRRMVHHAIAAMMIVTAFLDWCSIPLAKEPDDDATAASEKTKSETRSKFMIQALEKYEVQYADDPSRPARLHPKLLLRWSNPLTTIKDGALAVYTRGGRPDVVCEFHIHSEQVFGHEFSPIRFDGLKLQRGEQTVFAADGGFFKIQDLADAPPPAEKAVQRVAQMRQIAERFTVVDRFGRNEADLQNYVLRLMPQPVYRYEEAAEKVDGGMFVFAQGTNPEAVLLVEAVGTAKDGFWRYGFAPTTMYELTAHLKGEDGPVVWTKPRFEDFGASRGPYMASYYRTEATDISLSGMMPAAKPKDPPAGK
jgi:hypothetical protein